MTDHPNARPLPLENSGRIDYSKLKPLVSDAILGQEPQLRRELLELVPLKDIETSPFDDEGYLTCSLGGHRLLRLHWSRLMQGAAATPLT